MIPGSHVSGRAVRQNIMAAVVCSAGASRWSKGRKIGGKTEAEDPEDTRGDLQPPSRLLLLCNNGTV